MISRKAKKHFNDESGAAMVIMAFLIVILLGFTALAFDYGIVYYKDNQLQTAVDIAARAGSRTLADDSYPDADTREEAVRQQVKYYLEKNGFPEDKLAKCDVLADVNVGVTIDAALDVPLNFARIFGYDSMPIDASTTAMTEVFLEGGYEYIVDVVFVLDLSGSIYMNDKLQSRMVPMGLAVNRTINTILAENENNRVGIVVYSDPDKCDILMELTSNPKQYQYNDAIMYYDYPPARDLIDGGEMDECGQTLYSEGTPISFAFKRKTLSGVQYMHAVSEDGEYHNRGGSTDTQRGIYKGVEALLNSGRDGISRNPVIFVLTDGEATWGDKEYCNPSTEWYYGEMWNDDTRDSHEIEYGNGGVGGLEWEVGKYTILTASWAKQQIQTEYLNRNSDDFPTQAQIFTLGFELDNCSYPSYATYVLDPWACGEGSDYQEDNKGISTELRNYLLSNSDLYYNDEYYAANDPDDLARMMDEFASTVVAPTKYYKTRLTK